MLLLPALNAMIDITTTRTEAANSSTTDHLGDARRAIHSRVRCSRATIWRAGSI